MGVNKGDGFSMKFFKLNLFVPALMMSVFLFGCGGSGSSNSASTGPDPIPLAFTDPPVAITTAASFAADVSYGDDERNVFDIFLPDNTSTPTPLIMFIHGGGFEGGSKAELYGAGFDGAIEQMLARVLLLLRLTIAS